MKPPYSLLALDFLHPLFVACLPILFLGRSELKSPGFRELRRLFRTDVRGPFLNILCVILLSWGLLSPSAIAALLPISVLALFNHSDGIKIKLKV